MAGPIFSEDMIWVYFRSVVGLCDDFVAIPDEQRLHVISFVCLMCSGVRVGNIRCLAIALSRVSGAWLWERCHSCAPSAGVVSMDFLGARRLIVAYFTFCLFVGVGRGRWFFLAFEWPCLWCCGL